MRESRQFICVFGGRLPLSQASLGCTFHNRRGQTAMTNLFVVSKVTVEFRVPVSLPLSSLAACLAAYAFWSNVFVAVFLALLDCLGA